ncbi:MULTISPECIES: hypothetical protein [unclassified Sphingomonas]|uniref:hypothetical protein n=1 Tax=unclassified Sphingomonas TaxID=196159 RepID=UPI0009268069|nr:MULTISPECIES: hypothetical protein [unclassified Sphingomonas]OJU17572.1 MAG: hypothetical protein BGN95_18485 [Sphingomonas sp. 66-10]
MDDRVWFKKILFAYIPIKPEGFLVLFGLASIFFLLFSIISLAERYFSQVDLDILKLLSFVSCAFAGYLVAERRS